MTETYRRIDLLVLIPGPKLLGEALESIEKMCLGRHTKLKF